MRKLRRECRALRLVSGADVLDGSADSLLLHADVNIVLKVARNMRRNESVPDFGDRRRQPTANASYVYRSNNITPLSRPDMQGRSARSPASPRPFTSPIHRNTSSHNYHMTLGRDYHMPEVEKRPVPSSSSGSRGSSRLAHVISDSRPSSEVDSSSSGVPSPNPNPPTVLGLNSREDPTVDTESDHSDVRPLRTRLDMVESRHYRLVSGLVERPNGLWQPATGVLEPEQTFNFMTEHKANDLGLLGSAEQYTGEAGDVWIKAPSGGMINPTGTLQVRWRAPQSKPITLTFWLFPNERTRSLVLGAPFVSKTSQTTYYEIRET